MTNWRIGALGTVALVAVATLGWTWQGQAPPRRALPGDLTKPIAQYTGDEFFRLVNSLPYTGGQDRARRCTGNAACNAAERTNVRIDAVNTEDSLSAGNLPQFGVVAARLIVRGNRTEARYGMLPNGNARYSYYLIVQRGTTAGTATWRLEELSVQGANRTHRTIRTGTLRPCNHPFVRGARADFRTCQQAAAATPSGGGIFINASFGSLQGVEPPIWIACASGCCIADGT